MTNTTISSTIPTADLLPSEQDRVLGMANTVNLDLRRNLALEQAMEWKRQHVAACEQRDALAATVDRDNAELARLRQDLQRERTEALRFRSQVRDKAIEVQEQQGWCKQGLNEVLDDLGLDRVVTEWEVTVTVTATQTVIVTVEAVDEDDARDKCREGDVDISRELDGHDWEWQTSDDLEFESIREV